MTTPLSFNKGCHVAASPVLRLECAIVLPHNQIDHVINKGRILFDAGGIIEGLRDDEMKIAVPCMAEDDAVVVVVLPEECIEINSSICELFDGKSNVFDDHSGAAPAHCADRWIHAFSYAPERRDPCRVSGEF